LEYLRKQHNFNVSDGCASLPDTGIDPPGLSAERTKKTKINQK
jgi:hypothetical protein